MLKINQYAMMLSSVLKKKLCNNFYSAKQT